MISQKGGDILHNFTWVLSPSKICETHTTLDEFLIAEKNGDKQVEVIDSLTTDILKEFTSTLRSDASLKLLCKIYSQTCRLNKQKINHNDSKSTLREVQSKTANKKLNCMLQSLIEIDDLAQESIPA